MLLYTKAKKHHLSVLKAKYKSITHTCVFYQTCWLFSSVIVSHLILIVLIKNCPMKKNRLAIKTKVSMNAYFIIVWFSGIIRYDWWSIIIKIPISPRELKHTVAEICNSVRSFASLSCISKSSLCNDLMFEFLFLLQDFSETYFTEYSTLGIQLIGNRFILHNMFSTFSAMINFGEILA